MRWDIAEIVSDPEPNEGDIRFVWRFLWLPTILRDINTGKLEARWLETAYIRQEFSWSFNGPQAYDWRDMFFDEYVIVWPRTEEKGAKRA
jgi:hypothetical protein